MAQGAPDGWATIHVKPQLACFLLLLSRFGCVGVWMAIYLAGFSDLRWFRLVPLFCFATAFHINTGFFWRLGPEWAPTRVHNALRVMAVIFLALIIIPSFVGPEATMAPFQSRTYFILTGTVGLWLMVVGAQFGAAKQNLFPEPLTTLGPPIVNSIWNTIRILDPVTDMSLISIVLKQADPPCHWFGSPSACSRYIIMASCIAVFTFIYLLASIAITLGEKKLSERVLVAGITAQMAVFSVSFTCETLLVALTVFQLLTASKDPRLTGPAADEEKAQLRSDIIVTALSFGLTCAAFGTVVIMQVRRVRERVIAGGRLMQARVSRAASFVARRSGNFIAGRGTPGPSRRSSRAALAAPGVHPAAAGSDPKKSVDGPRESDAVRIHAGHCTGVGGVRSGHDTEGLGDVGVEFKAGAVMETPGVDRNDGAGRGDVEGDGGVGRHGTDALVAIAD